MNKDHALSHLSTGTTNPKQKCTHLQTSLFSPHLTIVACYCHALEQFEFWLSEKVVKPPAEDQMNL